MVPETWIWLDWGMGRAQKGDVVFCLLLALVALVLWAAVTALIWWTIGGIWEG